MAKLSRRERDAVKNDIAQENIMLMRVKRYVQYGFLFFLICLMFLFTVLKNSTSPWRIVVIVLAVITGLFSAFSFVSYRNGRKHVLKNINYLDANK
ncbi:MAG: hypothetical protein IJ225_08190 [Solobacterium sp.]|nr:hypothetical protein [Solobacterium sp.]